MCPSGPSCGLFPDAFDDLGSEEVRSDNQLAIRCRPGVAREVIEQLRKVGSDVLVRRVQAHVLVDPSRVRVEVAGPDVGIAPNPASLAPDHEQRLGVGLEALHPIHDVNTGRFEHLRPVDIGRFVEAGLQLDEHHHLLVRLGCLDQRSNDRFFTADRRIVGDGRAVERLFDRQHIRVGSRLGEERARRRGKRLVRVVNEDVALAKLREPVDGFAASLGEPRLGCGRRQWILELGPIEGVDAPEAGEAERGMPDVDLVSRQLQTLEQQLEHLFRHPGFDFESNRLRGALPVAQLALDGLEEIVGFFLLDRQIGAAGHSECRGINHVESAEESSEVVAHDLLDGHETLPIGESDESGNVRRDLHSGETMRLGDRIVEQDRKVQREVGNERERVGRIDREGGQHGEDRRFEHRLEFRAVFLRQVGVRDDLDSLGREGRDDVVVEEAVDVVVEVGHSLVNRRELLSRGQPVRSGFGDAALRLFEEAGDAHLVELVEIRRHDRDELDPLEERAILGQREREHTLLEREE